jgi:hypothetical protein
MGKRSVFERLPRDFYPTPYAAVLPLLPHLGPATAFIEPCVGCGDLVGHLVQHGHQYVAGFDIEPQVAGADKEDPRTLRIHSEVSGLTFITNPPWQREVLHEIIVNLSNQLPTWLLFDADWKHTRQGAPFMNRLRRIVSVGRVKWITDSKFSGKDNAAWYLFDQPKNAPVEFYGRAA